MAGVHRREFIAGGLGAAAGVGLDNAARAIFGSEKEPRKLVGGEWTRVEQDGKHLVLEMRVYAASGVEVHHVTFTASPHSAPHVQPDQNDIEQGSWPILGKVMPDEQGLCRLTMSFTDMGAKPGQEITVSADVYGRESATGHLVPPNYSPNGTKQLTVKS